MKKRSLASLLKSRDILVVPGAYDAFSARLIAQQGFPAVYLTGAGTTASLLGRPDLGFITLTEMCLVVRNICQAIDVPLIADGESGFGNAMNVARTVREYEQAGAAAIHLEDQFVPKRYAGNDAAQIVPVDEHVAKIKLAVKSRTRDDFLIIGRTDCVQSLGLDEAIRRGNAYHDAGADIVFVHGIATRKELREVGRAVRGPKLVNYSALSLSDQHSPPSVANLQSWGYAIVIFAIEPLFAAIKGLNDMVRTLATHGSARQMRAQMAERRDYDDVLNVPSFQAIEASYLPRWERAENPKDAT